MSIPRRDRGINATINFSLKEMRYNKRRTMHGKATASIDEYSARHSHAPLHCSDILWNVNAAKSVEYLQRAGWCIGLDMPADLPSELRTKEMGVTAGGRYD